MCLRWAWWKPAVASALLLAGMACGEPAPQTAKPVHADLYGDPLPPAALARMGTVCLRHGGFVYCVAFSKDGKTVVSGGDDAMVRLWDVSTGKEKRRFKGHQQRIEFLTISPDGKILASCGQDSTVRLWNLATGDKLGKLKARGPLYTVAFSPMGRHLAACYTNIVLWDMPKAENIREFGDFGKWIYCLAFTPDGRSLVSGGQDGTIRFWNVATGQETRRIKGHTADVRSLVFSPDGKYLASAASDGQLVLREATTGKEIRRLFKGSRCSCSRITFSPDSKMLAWSWGADRTIHLFDVSTGKEVRQFKGHQHFINDVAFSPDGKSIASAGADSTVRLWKVKTGEELLPHRNNPQSPVYSVAFAANDAVLVSSSWEPTIRSWDLAAGKELRQLVGHSDWVNYISVLPDGHTLLSVALDGSVRRWDIATGKERQRFRVSEDSVPAAFVPATLSPDGKTLAVMSFTQAGRLYDVETGKEAGRFGSGQAFNIAYLPDGKSLVLQIGQVGFVLWDVKTDKQVRRFQGDSAGCTCMAVSPDGKIFASGTTHNLVHRWEVNTGEQLSSLDGQQKSVESLAFSPDGRTLASGGYDGTIHLWEMATGQQRAILRGHQGPVLSVAFSHDGRRLASGSKDTTALIWDLTAGIAAASPKDLTPKQLHDLWRNLAGEDALKAYRSIWLLASAPKQSVPFLQARLRPVPAADGKRVAQLLADLDSADFKVRTKARDELEKLGEAAAAALHETAKKPPSAEVARQVKGLLEKLKTENRTPSPERIRILRALEVLEQIGTPEARQVFKDLAGGATEAKLTQEANASLDRLAKRAKHSR